MRYRKKDGSLMFLPQSSEIELKPVNGGTICMIHTLAKNIHILYTKKGMQDASGILSMAVGSPTYDLSDAGFCSFSIERDNILFRGAADMSKESMDWIEEQLKEEEDGGSKIQQQAETVSI